MEKIRRFYFRGAFDFSNLSFGYKMLISIIKIMLKRQKNPSEEEKEMLQSFENPVDYTDKSNILPLIEMVKG